MANLPRFGRTWQRFSSLPRPGSAPRPEIQHTEPEVQYTSAPATTNILQTSPARERSPPVRKFPSPPSSPVYRAPSAAFAPATSPRKTTLPQSPTYGRYDGERRSSAPSSPKNTFKLPATSTMISPPPKQKYSISPSKLEPHSPLGLQRSPPRREPQHMVRSRSPPEVQQKSILYEKTAEKTTKTEHRPSEYSSGKPHQKQQQQHHQQQQSDVININGENVGAVMHITESSGGSSTEIHKKKASSSNENKDELKTNKSKSNNLPGKSFMNSNFQGVNNSILYNSSLTHRDPGLHLSFAKKPTIHAHDSHEHHLHDSTRH